MHCCAERRPSTPADVWRSSLRGGTVIASRGKRKTNSPGPLTEGRTDRQATRRVLD
jgi:hypothetical protein